MKTNEEKIVEFLDRNKGNYQFKSPYHKNKKMLPFNINGRSYIDDFPIQVNTVSYRGWDKEYVSTGYTIESLLDKINSKFLIKCN